MRTHWPDDVIDSALSARNPQPHIDLVGSENTAEAEALLRRLVATDPKRERRGRQSRPTDKLPLLLPVAGVLAAIVVILLVVLLLPSAGDHPSSEAAAAELHLIAANAGRQSATPLGNGQWLFTVQHVAFSAQVSQVGATPTPEARATLTATLKEWTDNADVSCTLAAPDPLQFASSANQAAWIAAGLSDAPNPINLTSCISGGGSGAIDVSGLSTDPTVLAHQLSTGTTGIAGIDEIAAGENAGFERAAMVLVGPTIGATPAVTSALYNALALLPGVTGLGQMTTHSDTTGLGFAATTSLGQSILVVDPGTGALLEARNIEDPPAFAGLGAAYETVGGAAAKDGLTDQVIVQWLDPTGAASVVGTDSLPAGATSLPPGESIYPPVETGTIQVTAKLATTYPQLMALQAELITRYGESSSTYQAPSAVRAASEVPPTTPLTDTGASMQWYLAGSESQIDNYATALRASGLFSSVVVHDGNAS